MAQSRALEGVRGAMEWESREAMEENVGRKKVGLNFGREGNVSPATLRWS